VACKCAGFLTGFSSALTLHTPTNAHNAARPSRLQSRWTAWPGAHSNNRKLSWASAPRQGREPEMPFPVS
jgi:hypothetical protein